MRRHVLLFVAGGVVLGLCDHVHLAFGVLAQTGPKILGQGVWVTPVFGLGVVLLVLGYRLLRRARGGTAERPRPRRLATAVVLAMLAYGVTGPFQDAKWTLVIVLAAAWLVRAALRPDGLAAAFSLALAVGGPLVESGFWALGLHEYRRPDLLGVPLWLPGIYLHAALCAPEIDAWLSTRPARAASAGRSARAAERAGLRRALGSRSPRTRRSRSAR